jgi:carbamoyltransferase
VPAVVNTSFNDNEPIVCRPEEAIDCFLRTRMDALVLGDFLICRPAEDETQAESMVRDGTGVSR